MQHRIRAAALVEYRGKILLVKHVHPKTKYEWWTAPGGGIEDSDISIIAGTIREVFEETGITVQINSDPVLIKEFVDDENDRLNIELFFPAKYIKGVLTTENIYGNGIDEQYIKAARWFSSGELVEYDVFPKEIIQYFDRNLHKIYQGRH